MNISKFILNSSALILLASSSATALAQEKMPLMTATPQQINITSAASNTTGVAQIKGEYAKVLYGDPSKAGLYTVLLYIAPHKKIQALSHPDNGFATVLSGKWYIGFGDKFDESKLKMLPQGGIYTEPALANHFGETKDEPVILAITRYGPSGTTYVNTKDTPAK